MKDFELYKNLLNNEMNVRSNENSRYYLIQISHSVLLQFVQAVFNSSCLVRASFCAYLCNYVTQLKSIIFVTVLLELIRLGDLVLWLSWPIGFWFLGCVRILVYVRLVFVW
ncbi:Hypothetical_protein [Hexamita inflata]|uniref:Hypothetical_protein n=1 Tax=Hexamita inflata TaxID=28002 RepID=A0AA86QAE6_9EUKA|nr:Hypothetical protein HINF_LOCUS42932 [Hexamita inflata]CAI9955290.1 Hypothetical protein HINF_LOCUS42935 [Hexamita inflata]